MSFEFVIRDRSLAYTCNVFHVGHCEPRVYTARPFSVREPAFISEVESMERAPVSDSKSMDRALEFKCMRVLVGTWASGAELEIFNVCITNLIFLLFYC